MLKLERLELSGFKSFSDPVTVEFAGGITAIVGPNGCGKSNLSDGMSWVLGEQSAKSLRGGKMEDVIFNGSDSRRPLGMAEATLTLRTDPSFPHAEDGRIVIGRRVFRTGESQYRLNGKTVRLKEIKDLLMDTGLGIRAYSVIEQGKIGMILSSKPQERRKLLEEAAGITRYKARKRVAEVKLEEALANLLRLEDVIAEVERALRSLKRQASAARRFQEKQVEYKALLLQVLTGRWSRMQQQLVELQGDIEKNTTADAEMATALSRDEAALAAGREALEKQSESLAACHQSRSDLAAVIEGRQEFLKSSRQTLVELDERIISGRTLAERRSQESESRRRQLDELAERRGELLAERDSAALAVEEDLEHIRDAEKELRQGESRLGTLRSEVLSADTSVSALRNRLHQAQIEQERANSRRHHLEEESEQASSRLGQSTEALDLAQEKAAGLEASLGEKQEELTKANAALEDILKRESEATQKRQEIYQQLTVAQQRQDVLRQLNQAQQEQRSSLEEALTAAGYDKPHYLAKSLEAVEGWESSLDFYLGELTDTVVLDAEEASVTLGRFLGDKLTGGGGATLLRPMASSSNQPASPAAGQESGPFSELDDPAVILPLERALSLPPELARALPPAFLVETAEDAERLARQYPGAAFISRGGIWAEGGLLHIEGDRAIPGVLARERELADLAETLPRLESSLEEAQQEIDQLVAARAELAKEKNRLEGLLGQLRQDRAVSQARLQDITSQHERLSKSLQGIQQRQEEVQTQLAGMVEKQKSLEAEMAQATARHTSLSSSLERAQEELQAAKAQRESMRTASAGRRGRLDLLQERLDSVESELRRLGSEIEESERQAKMWVEEGTRLESRTAELNRARKEAEDKLQTALEGQESADEQVILEQEKLDDLRSDLRTLEERLGACREQRDDLRDRIEQLRIREASLKQEVEHLTTQFWEQFEQELPEEPPEIPEDFASLETELATTKATLDRLGPVNLLAVEEFQEQEERYAFLTTQRTDVSDSVASLRRTISEINATSSERFMATFIEVNGAFGEVFQHLFRGGEAEMRLLDEEDPLESGIEILARPPGKRLQNIQLMSGGEKALTAIALLFALFRTKPSPFCILDEVDAPLDDSNTVRFVQMLNEMASDTQFLLITHNKLSMEVASTLYGVTMEERGVSKLVSVEMEDVQPVVEQLATA
ncbi:MAG: chromosome segregation protein SMC [Deltaproteobacteria bacterium]|nr:chromosome segregation protein SMC [Deltaproteobacteria bacterium]